MRKACDRCGDKVEQEELLPLDFTDDYGEDQHWKICVECMNEIANGAGIMDDDYDIYIDRLERAYDEDPVNNPYPW